MQIKFWEFITKFGELPRFGMVFLVFSIAVTVIRGIEGLMSIVPSLLVTIGLVFGVCGVIKFFFYKPRPIPESFDNKISQTKSSSFPSFHTAMTATVAFFALRYFWNYQWLWLFFVVVYLLVSVSRVMIGKHDRKDLAGGSVVALVVSVLGMSFLNERIYQTIVGG